jgi:hypothetical protein
MILTPSFSASDQNKKAVTSQRPIIYTSLSRRPEQSKILKEKETQIGRKMVAKEYYWTRTDHPIHKESKIRTQTDFT